MSVYCVRVNIVSEGEHEVVAQSYRPHVSDQDTLKVSNEQMKSKRSCPVPLL